MKKLFFTFLLLITAWASASAYDFKVDGIAYNKNSDGTSVSVTYTTSSEPTSSSHSSYTGSVTIPATVTYSGRTYSVTSIDEYAFEYCSGLTSVTISNSVASIGHHAFSDCSGLTSVTIPNSVTSIGEWAFAFCHGLTSVTIPNSVTSIGDYAFSHSGLTSVTIPYSVTSIGKYAFGWSSLTTIQFGNRTGSFHIGEWAFLQCNNLKTVKCYSVASFCNISFANSLSNPLALAHNLYIGDSLVTEVEIPYIENLNAYAFKGCSCIKELTIPSTVHCIGDSAFYGCNLMEQVNMYPIETPTLGSESFGNLPQSVQIIVHGEEAFRNYQNSPDWNGLSGQIVQTEYLPNGSTFNVDNIEYRVVKSGLVEIIPAQYTDKIFNINNYVLYNNQRYDIVAIADSAFTNQVLKHGSSVIWFPESITRIGAYAFAGTTTVPANNLQSANCIGFKNHTIDMDPKAFYGNQLGVFSILNDARFCKISETKDLGAEHYGILISKDKNILYSFPGQKYTYGDINRTPLTVYVLAPTIKEIAPYAFSENKHLINIILSDSLVTIGEEAFSHTVLTSFTVPATVTTLGPGFIAGNKNISAIGVVADNTAYKAVDGCVYTIDGDTLVAVPASVSSLTIPEGVTTIVAKADLDGSLTKVTIPSTVATIGSEAFIGNPNITTIYCRAVNPPTGGVFEPEVYENGTLVIPEGAEDAYRADPNWGKFLTIHNDINDSPTGIAGKYLDAGVDGNGCNTCHYITIEDGTTEGSVTLSGFFGTTEKINGTYDAETGLLTIAAKQILLVDGGNVQLSLLDSKYKASDDIVLKFDQTGNATLTNGEGYGTILDNNGALSVYSPDNKWVLRQCKGLFKTNGTIENYRVEKFGDGVVAKDTTKFETAFVLNANQKSGTVYGFDGYTWQAFTIDSCSNVTFTQADVFYYNSSYGNGRFVNGYRWGYLDYGITGTIDMENGIITTDPWTTLMRDTSGVSYIAAYNGDKEKSVITFPVTGDDSDDTLPGDLNGDGAVDVLDLDIVIDGVLRGEGADVNGDGRTDIMDVDQVINAILSSK